MSQAVAWRKKILFFCEPWVSFDISPLFIIRMSSILAELSLEPQSFENSNILLVGAGGIGCEMIKNFAVCGIGKMTVVKF